MQVYVKDEIMTKKIALICVFLCTALLVGCPPVIPPQEKPSTPMIFKAEHETMTITKINADNKSGRLVLQMEGGAPAITADFEIHWATKKFVIKNASDSGYNDNVSITQTGSVYKVLISGANLYDITPLLKRLGLI